MRRSWPRLLLLTALVGLAVAPAAQAYRLGGRAWTKRTVTYKVAVAKYRAPMAAAARQWNTSGVRFGFREVRSGRADIVVRSLPVPRGTPCFGTVGRATTGNTFGFQGFLELHPGCSPTRLIPVAIHELGHVMGLGHSQKRCALMTPAGGTGCPEERQALPWEVVCRALRPDDLAGAIRRYGGRARPFPKDRICLDKPTPGPVSGLAVQVNPTGSLAAVRLTWKNPASPALRRIVVNREVGRCPTYPAAPGASWSVRPTLKPVSGDPVANVPSSGATQTAVDLDEVPAGTVCWAVWAVGPANRYIRAATRTVAVPGVSRDPARIGLTATPMLGAEARLAWQAPTDTALDTVRVLRAAGPCPPPGTSLFGQTVATLAVTPGAMGVDVPGAVPLSAVCYGLEFRDSDPPRVLSPVLVQLG